jgi:hypothetical protein
MATSFHFISRADADTSIDVQGCRPSGEAVAVLRVREPEAAFFGDSRDGQQHGDHVALHSAATGMIASPLCSIAMKRGNFFPHDTDTIARAAGCPRGEDGVGSGGDCIVSVSWGSSPSERRASVGPPPEAQYAVSTTACPPSVSRTERHAKAAVSGTHDFTGANDMKHSRIHDRTSWSIERADAMAPHRDDHADTEAHVAVVSRQTAPTPVHVPLLFGMVALLLALLLLGACSEQLPDEPIDTPLPPPTEIVTPGRDFVWRVDTIGMELSQIYDVAIINENDVWVVGMFDQPGDDGRYDINKRGNAARWDGEKWTIYNITDGTYVGGGAMERIFATHPSSIWIFSSGGLHFDGSRWSLQLFDQLGYHVGTNGLWVSNDKSVRVFAGHNSNLVYYRDGKYIKHPSPPGIHFYSVDGYPDGDLIIGGGLPGMGQLYRMSRDGEFTLLHSQGIDHIHVVSIVSEGILYSDLRDLYFFDGETAHRLFKSDFNLRGMAANARNDVFMLTNRNTLWHYNGLDTRDIGPDYPGEYFAMNLCVQGDLIYFVAWGDNQLPLVFRGERHK